MPTFRYNSRIYINGLTPLSLRSQIMFWLYIYFYQGTTVSCGLNCSAPFGGRSFLMKAAEAKTMF